MLPTATIVFREIIEIALVLGIVLAATRGLSTRYIMALSGVVLGVLGSIIIAFFTDSIANAIDGVGQEIFNATIIFIAVGFLSWTVIWMKTHGRHLAQDLKAVGKAVVEGEKSAYVLIGVVAFATFREGAEIVLFTYSMSASGAYGVSEIALGGMLGLAGGTVVGLMLYFGLITVAQKHLFTVTSWMLILLTAGMAATGANYLIAAGFIPELIPEVWDTSAFLSGNGFVGELLSVLIGYTPRPTGMELVFYASVLTLVGTAYHLMGRRPAAQYATAQQDIPVAAE